MNVSIKSGTVGYNNKILVSDRNFSLGENDKVNTFELIVPTPKISHKESQLTITQKKLEQKQTLRLSLAKRKELPR